LSAYTACVAAFATSTTDTTDTTDRTWGLNIHWHIVISFMIAKGY
jgi:hypothetical protein